ncbi:MAG: hypothetical protein AAF957_17395 [Planctomycetota bacterium]
MTRHSGIHHNGRPFDSGDAGRLDALHEDLRGRLDAWRLAEGPDDLDALGEVLARTAARPRRASLRPLLVGFAAAAIAFCLLAAAGARVERDGERIALSIALPWSQPAGADSPVRIAAARGGLEQQVTLRAEAAARRATTSAIAGFLETSAALERTRREDERDRFARLASSFDRALERERAHTARLVDALFRGASTENRRTREAVAELASHVQVEGR